MKRNGTNKCHSRTSVRFKFNCRLFATLLLFAQVPFAWSAETTIGPGVLEEVQRNGSARVVIALDFQMPLGSSGSTPINLAAVQPQISQMQANVLQTFDVGDYQSRISYSTVPAMVGVVTSEEALSVLLNLPEVVRVDLDVGGEGALANSVPHIGAELRHVAGNTGSGVIVAVLDSGIDTDHGNLSDDLVHEVCFVDTNGVIDGLGGCPDGSDRQTGSGSAEDGHGHGSHVSGIITSNGTLGSVGVAPDASIVSVKVLTNSNSFYFYSEIVAALDYIIANPGLGVQVINMSLGTFALFAGDCDSSTSYNMAGAVAVNALRASGITTFASSMNNGSVTSMGSPACLSNVISVGASDNLDVAASFTNSNASTDIFAPGVAIESSWYGGGVNVASGTSMASPTAAGCAALLIEAGEVSTPDEIETRLENSAFDVVVAGNGLTFPRVDCGLQPVSLTCNGLTVTVDLAAGDIPTPGDDVIWGTAGVDTIAALGGNDTICGNGGNDVINAGPGDDWVDAGDGDDRVFGLGGADIIFGGLGADEIISGSGHDLISGDDGNDILNGGPGDDMVAGGVGNDNIYGQGGDDLLNGGDGDDFIIGVDGADEINGGAGNDILNGGVDDDNINGGNGSDTIFGLSGDDTLQGAGGNDFVFGQLGNDIIAGGTGNDQLFGNEGNDTITVFSGTNILNGGPGNDMLTGGSDDDQIFGDGDLLQAGDDVIDGGGGADLLIGFAGSDTITSTDGVADTVNGGPGVDVCNTEALDTVFNCP